MDVSEPKYIYYCETAFCYRASKYIAEAIPYMLLQCM